MRNQMIELSKQMSTLDVTKTPVYVTLLEIKKRLSERSLSNKDIDKIMLSIKVDVNDEFVNDEELFEAVIGGFTDLAVNMISNAKADGIFDAICAAGILELTYNF